MSNTVAVLAASLRIRGARNDDGFGGGFTFPQR